MIKRTYFLILLFSAIQTISAQPLKIQWQQCYGGTDPDAGVKISRIGNNIYLFCTTDSFNGDIISNHGLTDFWIIKTDSLGRILVSKTIGGSNYDNLNAIVPTRDSGFIILGSTESNDLDVSGNHGTSDYLASKIDSSANILWQRCYGGSLGEVAYGIDTTERSGFICQGYSNSIDGQVTGNHGNFDFWITKCDSQGIIVWENSYGGSGTDFGLAVTSTHDNGAIIGGRISMSDGDIQCEYHGGDSDAWLAKLDSTGEIQWQHCYGGSGFEVINDIIELSNGDFLCVGNTSSNEGQINGNHGSVDVWVLKIDSNGNMLDQKCFGGSKDDLSNFIKKDANGDFLIGGYTYSNDGDVVENHSDNGFADMWIIKINQGLSLLWQQCFGGAREEQCTDMLDLGSGKYLLLGFTSTSIVSGNFNCYNHGADDVWLLSVKDTSITGIQEHDQTSDIYCHIYPNPARGKITFEYQLPFIGSCNLCIFNTLGEPVNEIQLEGLKGTTSWSIETVKPGMYYFFCNTKVGTICGKFIILGNN